MQPDPYPLTLETHWHLDFVTTIDVHTCCERLVRATSLLGGGQCVFFQESGNFKIERAIAIPWHARLHREYTLPITLRGTLEPVPDGTRVRAHIDSSTQARFRLEKRLTRLGIAALLLGIALSWLLLAQSMALVLLADVLLIGLIVKLAWRWRVIQWLPGDLLGWLKELLYVLPHNG